MESITACARAPERAISAASVSGGMTGASASFTDGARRVMPHDATARRVNRRIPNLFTPAKFAKSSHFAKKRAALLPGCLQEQVVGRTAVSAEQVDNGTPGVAGRVFFRRPAEMPELAVGITFREPGLQHPVAFQGGRR